MSTFSLLDLTAQVRAIGRASIFYALGKFVYSAGGTNVSMTHLGDTEGEIKASANEEYSALTLPELTGPAMHERYVSGENPTLEAPIYAADAALRDIVSPTGSRHGGYWRRRKVTEYMVALIPEEVFVEGGSQAQLAYTQAGGWTVAGVAATAAQLALLDLSLWFWRCHFTKAMPLFKHEDGGKVIQSITIQSLWNAGMPDGHHLYTVGRPDQAGTAIKLATA